jgi:hypothetical protein
MVSCSRSASPLGGSNSSRYITAAHTTAQESAGSRAFYEREFTWPVLLSPGPFIVSCSFLSRNTTFLVTRRDLYSDLQHREVNNPRQKRPEFLDCDNIKTATAAH